MNSHIYNGVLGVKTKTLGKNFEKRERKPIASTGFVLTSNTSFTFKNLKARRDGIELSTDIFGSSLIKTDLYINW